MNGEEGVANTLDLLFWKDLGCFLFSPQPEDQGDLGSCGDFCHPFPDKHRDKNLLSPETGAEEPDSVVGPG